MGKRDQYTLIPEDDPEWVRFWNAYPKRVAKKEARKAWAELNPSSAVVDQMIATLAWQSRTPAWTKQNRAFAPYPASWIRAERWTDEPCQPPPTTTRAPAHRPSAEWLAMRDRLHGRTT
jgi:hypothetical protein